MHINNVPEIRTHTAGIEINKMASYILKDLVDECWKPFNI